MGSAVESVDQYCLAEVAGLAALLRPVEEVELLDHQRLVEEAGRPSSQRSAEEAGLAGFAMVAENWTLQSPCCTLRGCSAEYLLYARAKDTHHHLPEHAQESLVMFTHHVFRSIPKRLHAFFFLSQSRGVSLS
jgi:hypothetical protein